MAMVGKVKWYNATKGYGFIEPEDGSKDIFVHVTAVERSNLPGLNEGQRLEFELAENKGRQAAVDLKVLD